MDSAKFAAIGECRLAFVHQDDTHAKLGYTGDTYHVAVYFSRLTQKKPMTTSFVTALGDDPYSDGVLEALLHEHVQTTYIPRLAGEKPGLDLNRWDAMQGFTAYDYAQQAAARQLCVQESMNITETLSELDFAYFSGSTLGMLDAKSLDIFYQALLDAKQQGTKLIFDPCYPASVWHNPLPARALTHRFLSLADIALPSFNEEHRLFGDMDPKDTVNRLKAHGVKEVVVKSGAEACLVTASDESLWVPTEPLDPVDTAGASEAFNAAYLACRLLGGGLEASVRAGHTLAAAVIGHKGAIIPKTTMPKLAFSNV